MEYRYLRILIVVIISFLVQCILCPIFRIDYACPNLVLIVVVLLGTYFGSFRGGLFGVVIGLIVDAYTGDSIGPYITTYLLCGFLAGLLAKKVYRRHWLSVIFVTIMGSIIEGLMIGLWRGYDEIFLTLRIMMEGILYNIIVCVPFSIVVFNFLTRMKLRRSTDFTPEPPIEI